MVSMSDVQVITTVCRNCNVECVIKVHVKNNDIVHVEGDPESPVSGGKICPRAETETLRELANDEKRLKFPMHKDDSGKWKRLSWDESLVKAGDRLKAIKKDYGAGAIAVYTGQAPGYRYFYWERFCNALGTPNYTTVAMLCFWGKMLAHRLTYGDRSYPLLARGITGLMSEYEENTKCMIIWGVNPAASSFYGAENILKLQEKRGAKLIVIDPRKIALAEKADIWAQLRPGTDAALALGLINVIIQEKLYNKEFVEKYTFGFKELAEHASDYTPEKVEKITWVPADVIREIARAYAGNHPGFIIDHIGVELHTNGLQAHRGIACLIGLTGNFDVPGGNILPTRFHVKDLTLFDQALHGALDGDPIGSKEFPLMVKGKPHLIGSHMAHGMLIPKAIEEGKIKALILVGADLIRVAPQTKIWEDAFKKLDTLIVIDLYKKRDYEDLAHIYLPAASFLEKTELVAGWDDPAVSLRRKCITRWESRPDYTICVDLARALGYGDYFPWESIEEAINDELRPTGLSIDSFSDNNVIWHPNPLRYKKYEKEGFQTPSNKLEFFSLNLKAYGYDPLPTYKEVTESPISRPDLAEHYPLILTTGQKTVYRTHTQFLTLPSLRKHFQDPIVEINPQDAVTRGIKNKDWVKVFSPRGEAVLKAEVTEIVPKGVVSAVYGFGGASNINHLTRMHDLDPISGYPPLRDGLCEVELCKEGGFYPLDEP